MQAVSINCPSIVTNLRVVLTVSHRKVRISYFWHPKVFLYFHRIFTACTCIAQRQSINRSLNVHLSFLVLMVIPHTLSVIVVGISTLHTFLLSSVDRLNVVLISASGFIVSSIPQREGNTPSCCRCRRVYLNSLIGVRAAPLWRLHYASVRLVITNYCKLFETLVFLWTMCVCFGRYGVYIVWQNINCCDYGKTVLVCKQTPWK